MTVIAAVVHDGNVYMGADTLQSNGYGGVEARAQSKLWRASNGMLLACTGCVRPGQVMRYGFAPPPLTEGQDLTEYLATTFADALRAAHRNAGTLCMKDGEEHVDVSALIGWRGHIFDIGSWFEVNETTDGYAADGSGGQVALAVLHATAELGPEERLNRAMLAAERFCEGVRGPFHILSTAPEGGS